MVSVTNSKENNRSLGPLGVSSFSKGAVGSQNLFSSFTNLLDSLSFRNTSSGSNTLSTSDTTSQDSSSGGGIWDFIKGIGAGVAKAIGNIYDAFFSQFQGPTNLFGHGDNANCGPTALGMVAEYFGALTITPSNAHDMTHYIRGLMGNSNEFEATTGKQLETGARALGLDATASKGSLDALKREVASGKAVIANVDSTKYPGGKYAKHWAVVTSIDERTGTATILDPQFDGPRTVRLSELNNAMNAVGNYMVAIGSGSGSTVVDNSGEHNHNDHDHNNNAIARSNGNDFASYNENDWLDYFGLNV